MLETDALTGSFDERSRRRAELRAIIAQTLPTVVITSSRGFMDVADFVMLKYLNSGATLAAILPAQMLMWSYLVIGFCIVMMVNTFVAQSAGRKEYRECSAYAWQSLYVGLLFGVLALVLIPLLPRIVAWIGHDAEVQQQELAYLRIAALTVFPTIAAEGLVGFFTGIHRPAVAMWTALESNVINVAVSLVLIFGWLGFPAMGIAGAITGTLVAVCYRMVRLAMTMRSRAYEEQFHCRQTMAPSRPRLIRLFRVGAPFGVQGCAEVAVWAIFVNILIGRYFGEKHLIANNAAWQYLRVAFMPCAGVGRAVSALVGKSIGAGDFQRAIREARFATLLTLAYMGSLAVIWVVFRKELIGWLSHDPEVIRIGAAIMICSAVFQLFDAVGLTYSGALRGAGDTLVPSIFFIISHWLIIVGGGWFMAETYPEWGSVGPWTMASGLIIVASVFLWFRWHSRKWMKIDLFGTPSMPARSEPENGKPPMEPEAAPS
jgi:MATE family multidrug resistance protein